jgi:hypothetical protein
VKRVSQRQRALATCTVCEQTPSVRYEGSGNRMRDDWDYGSTL